MTDAIQRKAAEAIALDICQLDDDTLRIGALEWGRP